MATKLHERLERDGRQLQASDGDLMLPLLQQLAAVMPQWLAATGAAWPMKVGQIAGVSRMDVLQTPAFSVRAHRFAAGYADITPHTHDWNFWSYCVRGGYMHQIYHDLPTTEAVGKEPVIKRARWRRVSKGGYSAVPEQLNCTLPERCL